MGQYLFLSTLSAQSCSRLGVHDIAVSRRLGRINISITASWRKRQEGPDSFFEVDVHWWRQIEVLTGCAKGRPANVYAWTLRTSFEEVAVVALLC